MDDRAIKRAWWKRYETLVVAAVLTVLLICVGWLTVVRRGVIAFNTTVQAQHIHNALMMYAAEHEGQLPTGPHWRQIILQMPLGYQDVMKSPRAVRLHEQSYCMVDGWTERLLEERDVNRHEHILIFENPASTDADDLVVVTWSGLRERLPRYEVLARLAKTRTGDGKPVTWEGKK